MEQDTEGCTALHWAIDRGHLQVRHLLLCSLQRSLWQQHDPAAGGSEAAPGRTSGRWGSKKHALWKSQLLQDLVALGDCPAHAAAYEQSQLTRAAYGEEQPLLYFVMPPSSKWGLDLPAAAAIKAVQARAQGQ